MQLILDIRRKNINTFHTLHKHTLPFEFFSAQFLVGFIRFLFSSWFCFDLISLNDDQFPKTLFHLLKIHTHTHTYSLNYTPIVALFFVLIFLHLVYSSKFISLFWFKNTIVTLKQIHKLSAGWNELKKIQLTDNTCFWAWRQSVLVENTIWRIWRIASASFNAKYPRWWRKLCFSSRVRIYQCNRKKYTTPKYYNYYYYSATYPVFTPTRFCNDVLILLFCLSLSLSILHVENVRNVESACFVFVQVVKWVSVEMLTRHHHHHHHRHTIRFNSFHHNSSVALRHVPIEMFQIVILFLEFIYLIMIFVWNTS